MSPADTTEQLKKELAAEREQLGSAVHELRAEVDELKRKLPKVAAAVAAAGAVALIVRRVVSR
jgi:outer membrane murein-binding lipoprotein Lpp